MNFADRCAVEASRFAVKLEHGFTSIQAECIIKAITTCLEEVKKGMPKPIIFTEGMNDLNFARLEGGDKEYSLWLSWFQENFEGDKTNHWRRFEKSLSDSFSPGSEIWSDWIAIKDDIAKRPEPSASSDWQENFEEEKVEWCEHIKWVKFGKESPNIGGFWGYCNPQPQNICRDWKECPICLAKRPENGGKRSRRI